MTVDRRPPRRRCGNGEKRDQPDSPEDKEDGKVVRAEEQVQPPERDAEDESEQRHEPGATDGGSIVGVAERSFDLGIGELEHQPANAHGRPLLQVAPDLHAKIVPDGRPGTLRQWH